jgi:hypothetical protein
MNFVTHNKMKNFFENTRFVFHSDQSNFQTVPSQLHYRVVLNPLTESKKTGKFAGNRDNASIRKMKNGESAAGTEAIFGVRAWAVPPSKIGVLMKCRSTVFLERMTVNFRKDLQFTGRCPPEKVHS